MNPLNVTPEELEPKLHEIETANEGEFKLQKRQAEIERITQKLGGHPVLLPIPKGYKHPYGETGGRKPRTKKHRPLPTRQRCAKPPGPECCWG